jgi:hypothetical protein
MENIDLLYTNQENFLMVLDSRNATSYHNGSFNSSVEFDLIEPIKLGHRSIVMKCSVLNFCCPNSIYIINEYNSVLIYTLAGFPQNAVTFAYGNYNANTFITLFKNTMPVGFNITFNNITNKFTITYTTDFSFNQGSTIYEVMGFAQNVNYSSNNKTLNLPFTCNFNGLQSFNIHFASLNTSNIDSLTKTNSAIIQPIQIPINSNQIFFQKTSDFNFVVAQDIIDDIRIDLKDDLGNLINLNNNHFNLTLEFTVIKDINRFRDMNNFHSIMKYGNFYY